LSRYQVTKNISKYFSHCFRPTIDIPADSLTLKQSVVLRPCRHAGVPRSYRSWILPSALISCLGGSGPICWYLLISADISCPSIPCVFISNRSSLTRACILDSKFSDVFGNVNFLNQSIF
jgi:hypothetical protein